MFGPKKKILSVGMMVLAGAALSASPAHADDVVGDFQIHTTTGEKPLLKVARDYDVGYVELMAANPGAEPWATPRGLRVVIPTRHVVPDAPRDGLIVNTADMRIYYYKDGQFAGTWPIGAARENFRTPTGSTKVVRKAKNPTWYPTAGTRRDDPSLPAKVGPGPDNPLGHRAMYLGFDAYLIHGTNKPYGIGRRVSRGCIRMYPEDVEYLYDQVSPGTRVTIVDQPVKAGWDDGVLYLEAHPNRRQADEIEDRNAFTPQTHPNIERLVRRAMGNRTVEIDWTRVDKIVRERRGIPVAIGTVRPGALHMVSKEAPDFVNVAQRPSKSSWHEASARSRNTEIESFTTSAGPTPRARQAGGIDAEVERRWRGPAWIAGRY